MNKREIRKSCEVFLNTFKNIVTRLENVKLLNNNLRVIMKDDAFEIDLT